MKTTTSHSMIKPILKHICLCFTFIIECAVITILNMILYTVLLLYDFVGIYLLWLSFISTLNKDLNKLMKLQAKNKDLN